MGETKDKIEGKAREVKGKVTGDKGEEMRGKAQQAVGNVKGAAKDVGKDVDSRKKAKQAQDRKV